LKTEVKKGNKSSGQNSNVQLFKIDWLWEFNSHCIHRSIDALIALSRRINALIDRLDSEIASFCW
jgi:hypothetical protein